MPNPTLVAKRNELDAKRKQLAEIFEQAGETMDMSKVTIHELDGKTSSEKAGAIKLRNEELTKLGKEIDEIINLDEIAKGVKDAETKARQSGGDGKPVPGASSRDTFKSLGRLFTESAAFKSFNATSMKSDAVSLELDEEQWEAIGFKTSPGGSKTLLDTTGFAPESTRTGLILPGALRRPVVGDLIPGGVTRMNAIKYMEETTTTNAADAVAEGATKPESALAFTEKTSAVKKIATVLPVTDELFEDEPAMRSYVEARLRLFMQLTEESELLNGSGAGAHLRGILQTSGIQTQAKGADPTPDAVYKAITLIALNAFLDADGVVFHPTDWQDVRLLRTADGIYIWGSPSEAGPERIWGLNVVKTPVMTLNTALVGAFGAACQQFRRTEISFAVSDQHNDFFITNKLMLRAEERLALVVYRPAGFATVTGV